MDEPIPFPGELTEPRPIVEPRRAAFEAERSRLAVDCMYDGTLRWAGAPDRLVATELASSILAGVAQGNVCRGT